MRQTEKPSRQHRRGKLGVRFRLAVSVLALRVALAASPAAPRTPENPRPPAPVPLSNPASPSALEPDKGRFRILVNGHQVGKEEFEIAESGGQWVARGSTDLESPQTGTHITGTLELRPDGSPIRYEWSTQGTKKASAAIVFEGVTATAELHMDNAKPFTQQFTFPSSRIVVLDNNLNYQYAVLARLYDWNKKGPQSFSVLVPQELTPGTATVESLGKQDSGGKSLDELRVKTEDNEIDLYLDGARLVRISVPGANVEIVRE
jgi:hypothetical protein